MLGKDTASKNGEKKRRRGQGLQRTLGWRSGLSEVCENLWDVQGAIAKSTPFQNDIDAVEKIVFYFSKQHRAITYHVLF
jgi:hypothetical protein